MTPLLPSVSVGTVETRTVIESIRSLVGPRVKYVEAHCVDVDPKTKTITCNGDGAKSISQSAGGDPKTALIPTRREGGASSRMIKDSSRTKTKIFSSEKEMHMFSFQLEFDHNLT